MEYLTLLYEAARARMETAPADQILVAQAEVRAYKKMLTDLTVARNSPTKENE